MKVRRRFGHFTAVRLPVSRILRADDVQTVKWQICRCQANVRIIVHTCKKQSPRRSDFAPFFQGILMDLKKVVQFEGCSENRITCISIHYVTITWVTFLRRQFYTCVTSNRIWQKMKTLYEVLAYTINISVSMFKMLLYLHCQNKRVQFLFGIIFAT